MTQAEQAFFSRMVPHIIAGKSFLEAGRAVLEDDERLWLAATATDDVGAAIREELAAEVYANIRSKKP